MLTPQEIIVRLLIASILGALIGWERERKHWGAGLRTHMLVSIGSCLIMIVSAFGFSDILNTPHVTLDPSRIAAQVVTGIGFIGGGAILFYRQEVIRGLTTAAGIWTVAGIGLATGSGLYFAAFATTLITFIILLVLKPIEKHFFRKYQYQTLKIVINQSSDGSTLFRKLLDNSSMKIQTVFFEQSIDDVAFFLKGENITMVKVEAILASIKDVVEVKELSWTN